VRCVNNQWGKSRQNIFLEEFCRLLTLPITEILPSKEPDAVLIELRQKRSKTGLLLLDHANDYGAEVG
jgi:hypothetical protein